MGPEARELTLEEKDRREALLKEYGEVGSTFRMLTDIRFKLIGFLPVAVAAAVALKPEGGAPGRIPFALFGLAATVALVTYNKRNDQLYDELVGRAAAIERELGLPDGGFANRPIAWLAVETKLFSWGVNHRSALNLVYFASSASWLYMLLDGVATAAAHLPCGNRQFADLAGEARPFLSGLVRLAAMAGAILFTWEAGKFLEDREKCRRRDVRQAIRAAGDMLQTAEAKLQRHDSRKPAVGNRVPSVPAQEILSEFRRPADGAAEQARTEQAEQARIEQAEQAEQFIKHCADARKPGGRGDQDTLDDVAGKIARYSGMEAEAFRRYARGKPGSGRTAYLLALLTDLPPGWIERTLASGERATSSPRRHWILTPLFVLAIVALVLAPLPMVRCHAPRPEGQLPSKTTRPALGLPPPSFQPSLGLLLGFRPSFGLHPPSATAPPGIESGATAHWSRRW